MVYVFLAEGFEEIEALAPVDVLRRGGVKVQTVGVTGKIVNGSHGIPVVCDITIDEATDKGLEAVVLPGGLPGTTNLEKDADVQRFLDIADERKLIIGAICAAPSVLGHKGLLVGKNAVCFPGFESELKGANVLDVPSVRDGNIVTGWGAGGSLAFAFELLAAITGDKAAADKLYSSMRVSN